MFSSDAFELVRELRRLLQDLTEQSQQEAASFVPSPLEPWKSSVEFTTHSAAGVLMDSVDATMSRLPWAFGGTVFLSFLLVAFTFGALLIPVKLFFTVALPITWVYGTALFVYGDSALDFLGVEGLQAHGGLMWICPVVTCTVLLGLALDYDIFLFSRIWEFRQEGFDDKESIQLGLSATGPIITSAGLVFSITFSGLILSQIPLNNQLGFIFVCGLLIDTFIVRTVMVPSVLSMTPILNWWPVRMPKPEHTATDDPRQEYRTLFLQQSQD
jgi:predicted RND superfamily exporter protein